MNPEVRYAFVSAVLTAQGNVSTGGPHLTRDFLDQYVVLILEAKDFTVTASALSTFLEVKDPYAIPKKLRKHYVKNRDYRCIRTVTILPGQPPIEYYLSHSCCQEISMNMNVPRSKLCRMYYIQVDKMYREFMDDKISWRHRTDSPKVWKHRREISTVDLTHSPGNYEIDFWKYDPLTRTWKRAKKVKSASDMQARYGTLGYEYEGLPAVVAATPNPESYKFLEECLHLEDGNRRIRGELYDMNNEESVISRKKCEVIDAFRKYLDKNIPRLGSIPRVKGISPTAQEFFHLKKEKRNKQGTKSKKHIPRLTLG